MANVVDLIQSIISKKDLLCLNNFLAYCEESRAFCHHGPQLTNFVSTVNSLLNENVKREMGLIILNSFLKQCPNDILASNLYSWNEQCVKGTTQTNISSLSFVVLEQLLEITTSFPEVRKQTALNIIPKLLDNYFKFAAFEETVSEHQKLKCLNLLLKHYGKSCSKWKESIKKFIFKHLESPTSEVRLAACCFLHLAMAGPPSVNSKNYVDAWEEQFTFLINELHIRLNHLFENISEIQGSYQIYMDKESQLKDSLKDATHKTPFLKMQKLTKQFESLATFLSISALEPFPVMRKFNVSSTLSVISRGLAINGDVLSSYMSTDSLIVLTQLPILHIACLHLMKSLFASVGSTILYEGDIIPKLLLETLKWTQAKVWPYGQTKPYMNLRVAAYKCLNSWLVVTKAGLKNEYTEKLVDFILSDINYQKPTVSLNTEIGKRKKSRKKNKNVMADSVETKSAFVEDKYANQELCLEALRLISPLVQAVILSLKPETYHKMLEVIIKKLIEVSHMRWDNMPYPYIDEDCRLELYQSLLAMCLFSPPKGSVPISYGNYIFGRGLHDPSNKVAHVCSVGMDVLGKMTFPCVGEEDFQSIQLRIQKAAGAQSRTKADDDESVNLAVPGPSSESNTQQNDTLEDISQVENRDSDNDNVDDTQNSLSRIDKSMDTTNDPEENGFDDPNFENTSSEYKAYKRIDDDKALKAFQNKHYTTVVISDDEDELSEPLALDEDSDSDEGIDDRNTTKAKESNVSDKEEQIVATIVIDEDDEKSPNKKRDSKEESSPQPKRMKSNHNATNVDHEVNAENNDSSNKDQEGDNLEMEKIESEMLESFVDIV